MIKRLGYACICNELASRSPAIFTGRTLRLASFSLEKVSHLALLNVQDLWQIIQWNIAHDIYHFRIGSDMFPFIDHATMGYSLAQLPDGEHIKTVLAECGRLAKQVGMRLTTHPGPYVCLGSPNQQVVSSAIRCIEYHRQLGEMLGLDDFVINVHVGGGYGDLKATGKRFCENFSLLSEQARQWLTIENDDKASLWSVSSLYHHIYQNIGIPIVFDLHHWQFCHNESLLDAAHLALGTWANKTPKMHYSESRNAIASQAHSDYIVNKIPEFDVDYDVMIEAKQKEQALLQYRKLCQP